MLTIRQDSLGRDVDFVDIGRSCVDPAVGELVVGLGYPVSSALVTGKQVGTELRKAVLLPPLPFCGPVLSPTEGDAFRDFDPTKHYLIPYALAKQGKHPRGISGAAVWTEVNQEQKIWVPKFEFAGICTSCYKNGTIGQIVKASVVRRFLVEVFGPNPN